MPYLTPDIAPGTDRCRALLIPDDPQWLAIVGGALSELTHEYNFEAFGTATPEQVAQRFIQMMDDYLVSECATVQDVVIVQDQKSLGTQGGTFTASAWRTRDINTEVLDTGNIASISANRVTLPAGTYEVDAWATAYTVFASQLRLYNITAGAVLISGDTIYTSASIDAGRNKISGKFVLSATSAIELQHICTNTQPTAGFGFALGTGLYELYCSIKFTKIA